uniref:Uncharacterized protein n=1 Tax=Arundo donax TaxID=35708 RepID=A0A0A8Z3J8_ARUDO
MYHASFCLSGFRETKTQATADFCK